MPNSIQQMLHELIDDIKNETLLKQIYEFLLRNSVNSDNGILWNKLNTEQQKELILSLEESNDDTNLISNEEVKKTHKNWL